jgi:hypothetical protein
MESRLENHYVMHTHEGCVDFKPGLRNLGVHEKSAVKLRHF